MDIHQELQFGQNEQIPNNKGSCLLDSEKCKRSSLDSNDNVYGNKASGIDVNRNNIVNAPFGSEINKAEGLDHIENLSGFREQHDGAKKVDEFVQISEFVVDEKNSVPADCVSMFTDIFGPPDDSNESAEKGSMDKPILSVNNKTPGSVSILLEVARNGSEVDETVNESVGDEDKNFVSGDIVWVMMKTKLWWPGFINESSAKSPRKKFIYKNCFLVKLFSSPSSVWASKSELKEFTCCFDEMIKQDNSRTFIAAVERAVNEISSHVKNELTCSCFQNPCPPKKVLELKSFALSRFEPDKFLSFIKHLAIDGGVVSLQRVQITVTRDCVSAFYRSLGHRQLQVHQLSPNRNSPRKRSRNETESSKNLKEGLLEKCFYGSSGADVAKIVKLSSGKMFDDLRWVAVDGSSSVSKERRYSGSLKRFFSCFRGFAFSKNEETEKPKERRNDSGKPEKPKGDNAAELDSSSVKPKKKRQRKLNLNPESVDEGQVGLDETKPEKKTAPKKKKKVVIPEANTASKIPDLNAHVFESSSVGSFFPITGQHAMSSVGGFPITGPHAMSSFGGFPVIGQHAMSSVGYIQIPGHAMPAVGGVQTTGHAMSSVGVFPIPGHQAMPSFGSVQFPGHAMSSVGGVPVQFPGHAMSSVGGVPVQIPGHAMSSVGGVPSTTGQHAVSSNGGLPINGHAMSSVGGVPIQVPGYAMSSAGGVPSTTGQHALSSVGGVAIQIPGYAMSSVGGVPSTTGHAVSSNGGGLQINGHATATGTGENEWNMTKMESAFINSGVGWLDSNGSSMSFVQLLNDVQGGKGFFENNNYFVRNNFASPPQSEASQINFASFPRPPFEANHINFSSQPQTNPIPPPELKKKRKRKPKEKPPILVNTITSPLPDLNGTTTTTTDKQPPPQKKKNKSTGVTLPPPSRTLLPKNGYKPVTLPSPPGFGGPPRASSASSPPDLAVFMKQKIEMMKSAMEKAGNSLSPEMRGKLENEIHGFTAKYNSMLGSSSSLK